MAAAWRRIQDVNPSWQTLADASAVGCRYGASVEPWLSHCLVMLPKRAGSNNGHIWPQTWQPPELVMIMSTEIFQSSTMLQRHAGLKAISGPAWDAALAEAKLWRIAESTPVLRFSRESLDCFTIVIKGEVKVQSVSEDGRTYCIYRVRAGELCILSFMAVGMPQREILQMSAEDEVQLLRIPKAHIEPLLAHSATFRSYMMASMAKHSGKLFDRIEAGTFTCLKSRILHHLQGICARSGLSAVAISHLELAEELGSTREAVSRTLKEMERSGQVVLGRRSIALANDHSFSGHRSDSPARIAM